jgi:perosamine synthetase
MESTKNIFKNSKIRVPFFMPNITNDDKKLVNQTLDSGLLTNGPNLSKFENSFSKYTKSNYSVGVSSATAALHLSLKALGIGKDDQVIVPDLTFVATANAVLMTGAIPIMADVNLDDFNINIESIKKNITKKTRAIIPVHFAGNPCNMNKIMEIAKKNNLYVVEDCAHALGSFYKNKHVGTFGHMGCFSFYPTKNITTLEGGMVITKSKKFANYITTSRNHGITKTLQERYANGFPWDYDVSEAGYNYRMDEIRAVLGIKQLNRIKKINQNRRNAVKYYTKKLSDIEGIEPQNILNIEENSCHLYIIKIDNDKFGINRNSVFKKLLKRGIQTSVHYKPLHKFSIFKNIKIYDNLKNSTLLYDQILSLPLYTGIGTKEQKIVIKELELIKNEK